MFLCSRCHPAHASAPLLSISLDDSRVRFLRSHHLAQQRWIGLGSCQKPMQMRSLVGLVRYPPVLESTVGISSDLLKRDPDHYLSRTSRVLQRQVSGLCLYHWSLFRHSSRDLDSFETLAADCHSAPVPASGWHFINCCSSSSCSERLTPSILRLAVSWQA